MGGFFPKICESRFGLAGENDPCRIAADRDHAGAADFIHAKSKIANIVLSEKTVALRAADARANVLAALAGRGAPVGVLACEERAETIAISFDPALTSPELIEDVIAVAADLVPARAPVAMTISEAARRAGRGLSEPDLDATRVIETYLA